MSEKQKVNFCDNCNKRCCKFIPIEFSEKEFDKLKHKIDPEKIKMFISKSGQYKRIFMLPECQFLKADKCSIYEDRPNICRVFPVHSGQEAFTLSMFCPNAFDVINDKRLNELLENITAGSINIYEEVTYYHKLSCTHPKKYDQMLNEIDSVNAEVQKWLMEYDKQVPEKYRNKESVGLNRFNTIPLLKPFFK